MTAAAAKGGGSEGHIEARSALVTTEKKVRVTTAVEVREGMVMEAAESAAAEADVAEEKVKGATAEVMRGWWREWAALETHFAEELRMSRRRRWRWQRRW